MLRFTPRLPTALLCPQEWHSMRMWGWVAAGPGIPGTARSKPCPAAPRPSCYQHRPDLGHNHRRPQNRGLTAIGQPDPHLPYTQWETRSHHPAPGCSLEGKIKTPLAKQVSVLSVLFFSSKDTKEFKRRA